MSSANLSMTVERLPMNASVPEWQRGRLRARICVSDTDRGDDVGLFAGTDGKFDTSEISAMLRVFAQQIDQKYNTAQE